MGKVRAVLACVVATTASLLAAAPLGVAVDEPWGLVGHLSRGTEESALSCPTTTTCWAA